MILLISALAAAAVLLNLTAALAAEMEGAININFQGQDTFTWKKIAEEYMRLNPRVKVNVELKPGEGYQEWIRAQFAGGTPAASFVNGNVVWDLVNAGKFIDYTPYLSRTNPYTGKPWGDSFEVQTQMAAGSSYWGGARRWSQFNMETVQVLWFYNKDIFRKVGVAPPKTWSELVNTSKKLKTAGYIPLAIEGDFRSFWEIRIGWLMRIYADQFTRKEIEIVRCQPGDYCYDEEVDGKWKYNPADPHNDDPGVVNFNALRKYRALRDGVQRVDSPEWREMYINFKKMIPEHTPPGFTGVADAYPLFLTQKAAMRLDGSWLISRFEKDVASLRAKEGATAEEKAAQAFEYGTFNMPTMDSPLAQAKVRTIEVAIGFWSVPGKERRQNDLEMDFLMFVTSPKGAGTYVTAKMDPTNLTGGLIGPLVIKGVELPADLARKFESITFVGNAEKETAGAWRSRGIGDFQESVREWVDLAQRYFMDQITLDSFLSQYQQSVQKHLPGLMKIQGYELSDLDTPAKKPPERKR
jgi:ABC-type glycerol-3-phosphate transport system substrate-binding protein